MTHRRSGRILDHDRLIRIRSLLHRSRRLNHSRIRRQRRRLQIVQMFLRCHPPRSGIRPALRIARLIQHALRQRQICNRRLIIIIGYQSPQTIHPRPVQRRLAIHFAIPKRLHIRPSRGCRGLIRRKRRRNRARSYSQSREKHSHQMKHQPNRQPCHDLSP